MACTVALVLQTGDGFLPRVVGFCAVHRLTSPWRLTAGTPKSWSGMDGSDDFFRISMKGDGWKVSSFFCPSFCRGRNNLGESQTWGVDAAEFPEVMARYINDHAGNLPTGDDENSLMLPRIGSFSDVWGRHFQAQCEVCKAKEVDGWPSQAPRDLMFDVWTVFGGFLESPASQLVSLNDLGACVSKKHAGPYTMKNMVFRFFTPQKNHPFFSPRNLNNKKLDSTPTESTLQGAPCISRRLAWHQLRRRNLCFLRGRLLESSLGT